MTEHMHSQYVQATKPDMVPLLVQFKYCIYLLYSFICHKQFIRLGILIYQEHLVVVAILRV